MLTVAVCGVLQRIRVQRRPVKGMHSDGVEISVAGLRECHETMAHAARLEQGILVTLVRLVSNE